jgi:DNA-binding transcriptional regulator LsrR (DeoR family)
VISLTVLGIGVATDKSTYVQSGFLTPREMSRLARAGAVGDILGHFFDEQGAFLNDPINRRVMGVPIDQLRCARSVIATAGGLSKVRAIRGALRTGCLTQLITDEETAWALVSDL